MCIVADMPVLLLKCTCPYPALRLCTSVLQTHGMHVLIVTAGCKHVRRCPCVAVVAEMYKCMSSFSAVCTLLLHAVGSMQVLVRGEPNISYICSRYYRAPELIFGATDYTTAIDVWSVGCVVAELLLGQPLFPGESGVDQLVEIIKVLGTPSREEIHAMNPNYTEFKFPQIKAHPWTKVFSKRMPPDAVDLVRMGHIMWQGRGRHDCRASWARSAHSMHGVMHSSGQGGQWCLGTAGSMCLCLCS